MNSLCVSSLAFLFKVKKFDYVCSQLREEASGKATKMEAQLKDSQ